MKLSIPARKKINIREWRWYFAIFLERINDTTVIWLEWYEAKYVESETHSLWRYRIRDDELDGPIIPEFNHNHLY